MTLAERRITTGFQNGEFPALMSRIEEAAGFPVPVEVNWESIAVPGESAQYPVAWTKVYFEPLIGALQAVGRDQMGLDALKNGLKKIVVQNVDSCVYPDCWAVLQDGVLVLDHEPVANIGETEERTTRLIYVLENSLA